MSGEKGVRYLFGFGGTEENRRMHRATGCQGGRIGSPPDSEHVLNAMKEGGRRVRAGGWLHDPNP